MSVGEVQSLIDWIHGARAKGKKDGLSNMRALVETLDHPEAAFRSIHVAGTNGKGSTCAFLESALRENGYKTGLYTSPYLTRYQERIRLSGEPIDDEILLSAGEELRRAYEKLTARGIFPTTFELGTALAFLAFKKRKIDVAVVETGLGGRLDPTNVLSPALCVISAIGYDHMDMLGDTLSKIAAEKAGIVKEGVPVVIAPQPEDVVRVFTSRCEALSAQLVVVSSNLPVEAEDMRGARFLSKTPAFGEMSVAIALPGHHQIENAALALAGLSELAAHGFALSPQAVQAGFERARWPGRLEWLSDNILIDGAHNEQGARSLRVYLDAYCGDLQKVLLTGMMRDKAYEACAAALAGAFDRVITTRVNWPKALDAQTLCAAYARLGVKAEAEESAARAFELARASLKPGELLVVSGSLYLVGETVNSYIS